MFCEDVTIASWISRSVVGCELVFQHVDCRSTRRKLSEQGSVREPTTNSIYIWRRRATGT